MTDEFKFSWEEEGLTPEPAFTLRSLLVGIFFGSLICVVNAFQQLTTGLVTGAAMVSSLAMYGVCQALWKGKRDPGAKEVVTAYNIHKAASLAFGMYPIALVFLITSQGFTQLGLYMPDWIVPNPETYSDVISQRIVFHPIWLQSLCWMLPLTLFTGVASLMVVSFFRYQVIEVEKLTFPYGVADAEVIRGVTTNRGNARAEWLFAGIVAGFVLELLLVEMPAVWSDAPSWLLWPSASLRYIDSTSLVSGLIPGASWVWVFDIILIGIALIIPPASSLSLAFGAIVFAILLPYFLISRGMYAWSPESATFAQSFGAFRYPYGVSLAIGILVSGALLPMVLQWRPFVAGMRAVSSLREGMRKADISPRLSLPIVGAFIVLVLLFTVSVLTSPVLVQAGMPIGWRLALFLGGALLLLMVLDIIVGMRTVGETGVPLPIFAGWLYRFIIALSGYRGFEAYYTTAPIIDNGGKIGTAQAEALKVGYLLRAKPLHQYIAALFGWTFGSIISLAAMFGIWSLFGANSEALPMPAMEANVNVIFGLATQSYRTILRPDFIAYGILLGAVLLIARGLYPAFPIVVVTFGMSAYLGALYSSTFLLVGLFRLALVKLKGEAWYDEKMMPLASGILVGGALSILFAILLQVIKVLLGG